MLYRLIYYSTSTKKLTLEDIRTLLKKAETNNKAKGVTGALYYNEKVFIQILEGGRYEVNETFHKICGDSKHSDIVITEMTSIHEREFQDWSMLYLGKAKWEQQVLLKYSPETTLNLDRMSSASILGFVLALKKIIEK